MIQENFQAAIEACNDCAVACDRCVIGDLGEADVNAMTRCIALDIDCASICRMASGFMSRRSQFSMPICTACADICDACAQECDQHDMDHCRECAAACRKCAAECRRMAA